jgi:predicted esterase
MKTALFCLALLGPSIAEEPEGPPVEERKAGDDAQKRYFLIGKPKAGCRLLLVLPGGDGSAEFQWFCKSIQKQVLGDDGVLAELVAPKWTKEQAIVWPTAKDKVEEAKFTTEEFVEAVVEDVKKRAKPDPKRIFALGWSSSGPALYAISLQKKKSPVGFYIAMSVFVPERLPDLDEAKGETYFLDHSPQDKVCPFRMAQEAEKQLAKKGARVKLVTYEGGHGWHGDLWGRMKQGMRWLEAR